MSQRKKRIIRRIATKAITTTTTTGTNLLGKNKSGESKAISTTIIKRSTTTSTIVASDTNGREDHPEDVTNIKMNIVMHPDMGYQFMSTYHGNWWNGLMLTKNGHHMIENDLLDEHLKKKILNAIKY